MPLGGNRVFLEETCLVARPALPFATLKRRLERRCRALGIKASGSPARWPARLLHAELCGSAPGSSAMQACHLKHDHACATTVTLPTLQWQHPSTAYRPPHSPRSCCPGCCLRWPVSI